VDFLIFLLAANAFNYILNSLYLSTVPIYKIHSCWQHWLI